jgi:hypothetical protein
MFQQPAAPEYSNSIPLLPLTTQNNANAIHTINYQATTLNPPNIAATVNPKLHHQRPFGRSAVASLQIAHVFAARQHNQK